MSKKSKISYLLLGIGIGIIGTSTLYSFYPNIKYVDLSNDIIIEKARELGMVWLKENIDVKNINGDNKDVEESGEKTSDEDISLELGDKLQESIDEEVEVTVVYGVGLTHVANDLYEKNLIEDPEDFISFGKEKKVDKKIRVGRYKIKPGSSYEEIIETFTKIPKE